MTRILINISNISLSCTTTENNAGSIIAFLGGAPKIHNFSSLAQIEMNKFLVKYPSILRRLYPRRWTKMEMQKSIYLTFDDGPITEVTPWVLDLLKEYNAHATFFCIGDNVQKHPEIFRRILSEGHSIGNHAFNHLDGWKTATSAYIENVSKAEEAINSEEKEGKREREKEDHRTTNNKLRTTKLFRPPYGRIKNSQARKLANIGYQLVMWDVISYDFDENLSEEECLQNVLENAEQGSIIVFHDSRKAFINLEKVLPQVLEYYKNKNFSFKKL
ncbi:polysaccharide deacetylase family protein [Autumnicola psychrophila]|uniref:Polysaccharide deacetylase family protein n=1 Tax=Autumnicola psychrophila TaxID=3075592 RepID=A0ABU3DN59_9FLAO|nr:polysaccharide deacetylase family protein [Zunongwangia sp. F225]MDT0685149.1 polysaccharide deacetylase family protein [Zunongwangia sp. F225]